MILAEKITLLRKKSGMSQEELADKLGVSRQSISKWESAQSTPDLKRILAMSELFGVSTDILLKDEEELPDTTLPVAVVEQSGVPAASTQALRQVSMEEATEYMKAKTMSAGRIAIGVMMCILSPITLIILGALQEGGAIGLTENQAGGIGITVLMLLIGGAVALFIYCGTMLERFEYIQKEPIETAYGVSGMVSERLKVMRPGHTRDMIIGITLCVLSCVPIFIPLMLNQPDWRMSAAVGATLFMIAIGVLLIVRTSIVKEGLEGLLEEGEFSRENKLEKKRNESIMTIYWAAALVIFLALSFITNRWDRTWIVWPIAGVACGLLEAVLRAIRSRA